MIPWQKYDPENPPEEDVKYLISDGQYTKFGYFAVEDNEQYWYGYRGTFDSDDIKYYAPIDLPGEENGMTREEILAMEPGKKLDWEIAKFMGVNEKLFRFSYEMGNFNYSSDISAAWEVVDMLKIRITPQSDSAPKELSYMAEYGEYEYRPKNFVFAETAPEAICKAALLAILPGEE